MSDLTQGYKRVKYSCYFCYVSGASAFALPPLLFSVFHETYGISYTLLGTLVLVNFLTQLSIDLIFSFFAKYFNTRLTVRLMPILSAVGLAVYALSPFLFSGNVYTGLLIGTVIFSLAGGLSEVLLSPTIAALPSKTPDRDMSLLHSLYAVGVLLVVLISTAFFMLFDKTNWMYLTLFFAALPIVTFILFATSPLPDLDLSHEEPKTKEKTTAKKTHFGLMLCVFCIFLGGAAECAMTNWVSVYMESALGLTKAASDIAGLALFAVFLGLGRILYARYGKNIQNTLLLGMASAAVCYLVAVFSPLPAISAVACILTGLCTAMLWPGTLIMMEEKFPHPGVAAYALMAAGGDLGGSVAPQLVGAVVDIVETNAFGESLAARLSMTAEQVGMKVGMLVGAIFPLVGIFLLLRIKRYFKRETVSEQE